MVLVALLLRLSRASLRWDEIALAYAAYQQPWPEQGWLTFFGLHPPGYSAVFALLPSSPAAWLGFSALCSTAAVWLVGRVGGLAAAAVLAADPLQLAYAAEVNNYPLLVFLVALCLHEHHRGRWWGLALAGAAAGWTHLLGGLVGGLLVLTWWRRPPQVGRALALMGLLCAPVVVRALQLAGAEGTTAQGGLDLVVLGQGLWTKVGWWALVPVAGMALAGRRSWLAAVLALTVLAMMGLGVAASHQQPYWLLLGPPVALLFHGRPRDLGAAGVAVVLGLGWTLPGELQAHSELQTSRSRHRAIDAALEWAAEGDALWLLKPALKVDDDKSAWSDVLWRFSPWQAMPEWEGDFEYVDYRYGQPRRMNGLIVHSSTDLDEEVVQQVVRRHLDAGRRFGLVLYDHGPANDYPGLVERVMAPFTLRCEAVGGDVGLGVDALCEVSR